MVFKKLIFFYRRLFKKIVKQNACGAFLILVRKFRSDRRADMGEKALVVSVTLSLHCFFAAMKLKPKSKYAIALV